MTTRTTSGEQLTAMPPGPGEIYTRLAQIMAEVPAIPKAQRNQQQNYAFRGIDDVFNALHGLFAKHEVVILPEVLAAEYVQQLAGSNQNLATDARLLVRYHFVAPDGSSVSMTCQGESRDYADKATNQALSSGFKYGLLQMFLIPLEGEPEADASSPQIEDPMTDDEVAERDEWIVKARLVEILGTKEAAAEFWDTHQGMTHDEIVAAATQLVADDQEAVTGEEGPPTDGGLGVLVLGKVPTRKGLLQEGITDMMRLGDADEWLEAQLAAADSTLADLTVADLKTLYAALQHELANA